MRESRVLDRSLLAAAAIAVLLACAAVVFGGVSVAPAGIRISSRTAFRPLLIAAFAIAIAVRLSDRRQRQVQRFWELAERRSTVIALCLSAAALFLALHVGQFEARAADQYGYVSQAELWAHGHPVQSEPLAAKAPWPNAAFTFSPLGYRPGRTSGTIVPTYPAGLPLLMAVFFRVIGPFGIYLAVPLLAMTSVWVTFLVGRHFSGPICGAIAAALLLSSPIFLFQAAEPMSDVPVTAWFLLLVLFALSRTTPAAVLSGLAGSAAILTRPNLLPAIIAAGVFFLLNGEDKRHQRLPLVAAFAGGIVPGCLAVALINQALYGSPFESGYGTLEPIFSFWQAGPNLQRYPRWLLETETPLVCVALLAPWVVGGHAWPFLATVLSVFLCYLFYLPFEVWTYLRFLLPAIPLILVLTSGVIVVLSRRFTTGGSRAALAAVFLLLVAWRWDTAAVRGVQPAGLHDRRYATMGMFVRDELPSDAVIVTVSHSGSVRYYSGRITLRWDWLPPEWLDPALDFLRTQGYRPYFLIEDDERRQFEERFGRHSVRAALDWPPLAAYGSPSPSKIYDPDDRDRSLRGETVTPVVSPAAAPRVSSW